MRLLTPIATLLVASQLAASAKAPRRFNLPCLAPLLERVDPDAPLTLDDAFLVGPWHAPTKRETTDIGLVEFNIATETPEAREWFNQGLALLHTFWYSEAEKCFRHALTLDPKCPMLYWGLAMANERRPQRAAVFADEAKRYSLNHATLSKQERAWIGILTDYYSGRRATVKERTDPVSAEDNRERRRARIRQLEQMAYDHPDDLEPKAFLLRQVILDHFQHADPIANYYANDLLANELAETAPKHPSRHYRLFLWLNQNPQRALEFAADAPLTTPGIPDAWRYAGQIYQACGELHNAVPLFEKAVQLGLQNQPTTFVMPDAVENLVSNYESLIDALTSMGRYEEARAKARELIAFPRTFYLEKRHIHAQHLAGSYATGRRLLGQLHLRLGLWKELLAECQDGALGPGAPGDWHSQLDSLFWQGLAQLHLGDPKAATAIVDEMKVTLRKAKGARAIANEAEEFMVNLARTLRTQIEIVSQRRHTLPDKPTDTTWLPTEHLAETYFTAGLKQAGIKLIDEEFAARPGQFLTVATYSDLHFRNGDSKAALYVFDAAFRAKASAATPSLPGFAKLLPVAEAMRLGPRWKKPAPEPSVDPAPKFAWKPPTAPAWKLPDHSGKRVSLADYKGKPVVINFFLGVTCPFCRQQIDKFRASLPAFEEAGIEFIAITNDTLEAVQKVTGANPEKSEIAREIFPFPVYCDPASEVFKTYRAYDDFENFPMHATFLVGPKGKILWHDIGHAPFNHPTQLLREIRRLSDSS